MKVKNGYFVNVAKIGTIKQFVASGALSHCQGCTYLYIWSCGVSRQKRSVWPEEECLARRGVSGQKWSVWPEVECLARSGVSRQKWSVCPEEECLARSGVSVQKRSVWPIYINTHAHTP